jgi:hypothetical protein
MKHRLTLSTLLLLTASALVVLTASAAGDYAADWWTVDGGGGPLSTGGTYSLGGTIGQPDAGPPLNGGIYSLTGGFWSASIGGVTPPEPVTISGNASIAGALLGYVNGGAQTAIADGTGAYTISLPSGWSGTVTPAKSGYAFSPASREYTNITSDQTGQDYTATGHLFADVPVPGKEWMEPWIVAFYQHGITTGCGVSPLRYCPENRVTRAEMAVFLLRAIHGASYVPPAPTHDFADVPVTGKEWMEPWIEQFYTEGITTGCGGGNYCPENNVTRAEMAVFVLRALHGGGYTPPAATHTFADVPVPGKEWMEPWIDQFAAEGITTGCGGGNYCPENNVTRAEMAVFIDRAYGLYP